VETIQIAKHSRVASPHLNSQGLKRNVAHLTAGEARAAGMAAGKCSGRARRVSPGGCGNRTPSRPGRLSWRPGRPGSRSPSSPRLRGGGRGGIGAGVLACDWESTPLCYGQGRGEAGGRMERKGHLEWLFAHQHKWFSSLWHTACIFLSGHKCADIYRSTNSWVDRCARWLGRAPGQT
jgi:hypothetical protein